MGVLQRQLEEVMNGYKNLNGAKKTGGTDTGGSGPKNSVTPTGRPETAPPG